MIHGEEHLAAAFLAVGAAHLVLLRHPLAYREKPGSVGFGVAVVAISLWPLSLGTNYLVADRTLSLALWNLRLLAAPLVSVGWFLVAYEFTTQRLPRRRILVLLAGYVAFAQLLAWTNPLHHLVLTPATTVAAGVVDPAYGPWFWARTTLNYGLIVGATALLAVEYLRSTGLRRRQAALLTVAVVPPIAANLVSILDLVGTQQDLTPVGLVGSGLLLWWALYRTDLLDVSPVARELALEAMGDAVLTVDEEGRLVDCNRAARTLFAVPSDYFGVPAATVFAERAPQVRSAVAAARDVRTEVSIELDGETRHFSLSVTPIGGPDAPRGGRVVVLREVTPRKRREEALAAREQELDLLRQVLTRVLRHNIRNELTTIRGNAALVAEEYPDERLDRIVDASDRLVRLSDETRDIDRLVGDDPDPEPHDLARVVGDVVETVRAAHPDVQVEADVPADCAVACPPGLELVVENLVENAAEHNRGATQSVRVTAERDGDDWRLAVADDGPGIPDGELAVLAAERETSLSHGSGLGLWIVTWWAETAPADVDFESGAGGTTATVALPAAA